MPCRGCGGSASQQKTAKPVQTKPESVDYAKVLVRYLGPIGNHEVVGRATRIKAGRHRHGDEFWIHREDAEAQPELFKIIGTSMSEQLPVMPSGIRRPPTPPPPPPPAPPRPEFNMPEIIQVKIDPAQPISALELPSRIDGALGRNGVETVADLIELVRKGDEALLEINGIGEGSVKVIKDALRGKK